MRFLTTGVAALVAMASCTSIKCRDNAPTYRDELLSFHKSIVSIPSISGDEKNVGDFLIGYLDSRGYKTQRQAVAPQKDTPEGQARFNVLAWHGDSDECDPRLIVTSHIDVVPPYIPYTIEDGPVTGDTMIKGRGTADAKGSVASMVIALDELLKADKVKGENVMLVFVVGEENSGDGMTSFNDYFHKTKQTSRLESAIFGEPTENKLACGHKGGFGGNIKAKGIAGHSGYPEQGKSATEIIMRALVKVLDADLGSSDYYGNTTANVAPISGGVAGNIIADEASAQLLARVAVDKEHGGASFVGEKIEAIFKEVDPGAFTFDWLSNFNTAIENYDTDLPHLNSENLVKYLYRPGSILVAHSSRENLTVSDLETSVAGYQKLILHTLQ